MTDFFDLDWYENIDELVMDYNGLSDPFTMSQQIGITNTYSAILYFKAELMSPGANYTNYSIQLGSIAAGISDYKAFTFDRALPGAKATDSLTLRVTAYTDAGYSNALCHDELTVSFYLYDHDALTLVDHDAFDDGTVQGWASTGQIEVKSDFYINAPYSLSNHLTNAQQNSKTFTIGSVTEAFLTIHWYKTQATTFSTMIIAGTVKVPVPILTEYANSTWYRMCFKIPVGQDVLVQLSCNGHQRVDEIWVVTHTA